MARRHRPRVGPDQLRPRDTNETTTALTLASARENSGPPAAKPQTAAARGWGRVGRPLVLFPS